MTAPSACGASYHPHTGRNAGRRGNDVHLRHRRHHGALAQANAPAGDRYINLMGANTAQQFLSAGLFDEIQINLIPALRVSAGSDGGEEVPVGFAGVEQRADAVVRKLMIPKATRLIRFTRLLTASVGPFENLARCQAVISWRHLAMVRPNDAATRTGSGPERNTTCESRASA